MSCNQHDWLTASLFEARLRPICQCLLKGKGAAMASREQIVYRTMSIHLTVARPACAVVRMASVWQQGCLTCGQAARLQSHLDEGRPAAQHAGRYCPSLHSNTSKQILHARKPSRCQMSKTNVGCIQTHSCLCPSLWVQISALMACTTLLKALDQYL